MSRSNNTKEEQSPPPRKTTAKLSGSLMNMRFMQRQKNSGRDSTNKQRHSSPQKSLAVAPSHASPIDRSHHSALHGDESRPVAATPMDMYDVTARVIGRRSFGGFNKPMEEVWRQSYQQGSGASINNNDRMERNALSDKELLQRYQSFVGTKRKPSSSLLTKQQPNKRRAKSVPPDSRNKR